MVKRGSWTMVIDKQNSQFGVFLDYALSGEVFRVKDIGRCQIIGWKETEDKEKVKFTLRKKIKV